MMSTRPKPKVYRLRGCPAHLDRLAVVELLSRALGDISPNDIKIRSLATNTDPRIRPPTKVGTLTFIKLPSLILSHEGVSEWKLRVDGLENHLILDSHFLGVTVLNDIEKVNHEFDCIAISGLASHPFGSWQPRGEDKSFMWIRDGLPRIMPNIRASIYGYDTTLEGSDSFQSIEDLGKGLINHLHASGLALPSAKPLIFLAHSLGGIVLKEAFVSLARGSEKDIHALSLFKGGIFFGVPSQGMDISYLRAMVKGQTNESLLEDLSTRSEYLLALDNQFSGLSLTRSMCIHWAYETKTSATIKRTLDGSFAREGPKEILVSKESATRNRWHLRSSMAFPINEDHSDIVKFREDDTNFHVVSEKMKQLCRDCSTGLVDDIGRPVYTQELRNGSGTMNGNGTPGFMGHDARKWSVKDLVGSLGFRDERSRLHTIDERFEHTFEWVFDVERLPLSKWLKYGKGFFWIHGKPGSGKSTLMKFICQSPRTQELLHKFPSEAIQITVNFFFHDRGTLLQKSFEGLLRSVLRQIIVKAEELGVNLTELLNPLLEKRSRLDWSQADLWTIGDLESGIHLLFRQTHLDLDIFLILDALDEYDGQPDFICDILEGLMKMTSNSRTNLKILFSSRPWETFRQQFNTTPSLRLQDHTQNDIRDYSWGRIEMEGEMAYGVLQPIIPEVIRRADGVFLWVKLVLYDLIDEALQGCSPNELAATLDSIPSDLQEYYARTVQRIPENFRWDAYVILELLSHSREGFDILRIMEILECSRQATYRACHKGLDMLVKRLKSELEESGSQEPDSSSPGVQVSKEVPGKPADEWTITESIIESHRGGVIRKTFASAGNLVELNAEPGHKAIKAQLAHQTVREFVRSQDFKRCILGRRARQTHEASDTFIAKYHITNHAWDEAAASLLRHESATGYSLKSFLDSVPKGIFSMVPLKSGETLDGPLALAMLGNLQLFLEETLYHDPDAFKKTEEKLLLIYPFSLHSSRNWDSLSTIDDGIAFQKHLTLLKLLFDNGYTIGRHPLAFEMILQETRYRTTYSISPREFDMLSLSSLLEEKAALLVGYGQDPNIRIRMRMKYGSFPKSILMPQKALHLAKTAKFIRCLIEHGSDVNEPDGLGNSPLDCLLMKARGLYASNYDDPSRWPEQIYDNIKLFIRHDGMMARTSQEDLDGCLSELESFGYDVMPLRDGLRWVRLDSFGKLRGMLVRRVFKIFDIFVRREVEDWERQGVGSLADQKREVIGRPGLIYRARLYAKFYYGIG
ncbi:hypothetical protein F5Y04DRAFT_251219 [Hypomontagnella monticulosa]|nr:hypothetical protein F5Y04DRAFT_251219 [Hypomontagnella monticulosa]